MAADAAGWAREDAGWRASESDGESTIAGWMDPLRTMLLDDATTTAAAPATVDDDLSADDERVTRRC